MHMYAPACTGLNFIDRRALHEARNELAGSCVLSLTVYNDLVRLCLKQFTTEIVSLYIWSGCRGHELLLAKTRCSRADSCLDCSPLKRACIMHHHHHHHHNLACGRISHNVNDYQRRVAYRWILSYLSHATPIRGLIGALR